MRRTPLVTLAAAAAMVVCGASTAAVNPQIAGLQVALSAHRAYLGPVDGIAGAATAAAVRSFQRETGLPVDGLAGPVTRRALGKLGRPLFGTRLMRRGMAGWDVSVLQFLLLEAGFPTSGIDGHFGPHTLRAVRQFQRLRHLVADGIVGPATVARLCPARGCSSLAEPPRARRKYVVGAGDTLTGLAARFGTTVATVAQANGLPAGATLKVGEKLALPVLPSTASLDGLSVPPARLRRAVSYWARHYGVDPHLARAVAWMESGFQAHLRSSIGAWGVMQVTPETWDYVESVLLQRPVPHTAYGNIRVGVAYLHELLREFGGNEFLAVAAYHQGAQGTWQHGVLPAAQHYADDVLALKSRL